MSEDPQQPVTRRAMRLAEQQHAASATTPAGVEVPSGSPVAHRRVAKSATVLVLSAALTLSGLTLEQAQTADAADAVLDAQTAQAAGVAAEQAAVLRQVDRTSQAQTARLGAHGQAYALSRRNEALVTAEAALAATETVMLTAAPVVEPALLTPLASAVASLQVLLSEGRALSGVEAAATAGVGPDAAGDGAAQPGDTAAAAPGVLAPPRTDVTAEGPGADSGTAIAAARTAAAARASRSPGRLPLEESTVGPGASAPGDAGAPVTGGGPLAEAPQDVLVDSTRLTALAAEVGTLASQVQAAADAKVAEAHTQALAEQAAQAAAKEIERKVTAAQTAANGDIPLSALCAPELAPDERLRCDAAAALERLNDAYRADTGQDLDVVSSYRSYSAQVSTRRTRGWLAAVPGTSNHGLAVAVDFGGLGGLGNFRTSKYLWLKANAADFGWFHPRFMEPGGGGPQEPWHWEFAAPE